MPFLKDIEQVYAAESVEMSIHASTLDISRSWKKYIFPYPSNMHTTDRWGRAGLNVATLKKMFTMMELRNGADYIFCRPDDTNPKDGVHVRFKNEEEGLMATMRWLASDWYRKKS